MDGPVDTAWTMAGEQPWAKNGQRPPRRVTSERIYRMEGEAVSDKSFSNGNGLNNGGPMASPATVTVTGVHLGAGDEHWWRLA